MHWKTARAVTIARDPQLPNRPAPGVELLASDGGIFSSAYLYPTGVYRPVPELDIKLGDVLALSTADVVDAVRLNTDGQTANFDGGDAGSRFMGVELDAGGEYRVAILPQLTLQLGLQLAVLFPGGAFDDAAGHGLGAQFAGVSRVGLQF